MSTIETQIRAAQDRWNDAGDQHRQVEHELRKAERGEPPEWLKLEDRSRLRRRLTRLGEYDAAERLVNGDDAAANVLERVIGRNQLFGIEFFERGLIAARAVARVEIRGVGLTLQGYGSGVLVSPRLFLTNNHVLPDANVAAGSIAQFEYLTSATGTAREPLLFRMRPAEFFLTDDKLDFSLVALEEINQAGQSTASRGWCPLIPGSGKAIKGERVNLIQHPKGERMQVTVRENTIVAVTDNFLQYQADTEPGSSGAPVFNDQWEMAALHHAGVPKRDPSGRILMRNGAPWTGRREDEDNIDWLSNEGLRVSSLIDFINAEYVTKQRLNPQQRALWESCFSPPRPLELWDLFSLRSDPVDGAKVVPARTPESSSTARSTQAATEQDGQASWLFRLSFGPVAESGVPKNVRAEGEIISPSLPAQPPASATQKPSESAQRADAGVAFPDTIKRAVPGLDVDPHIDPEQPSLDLPLDLEEAVRPWRVAKCLEMLRRQVNSLAPSRSKASDGTIGDAAHATRTSDHNPWLTDGGMGVVTAMDITHDPQNGCDAGKLAEAIRASRDPRVKYVIWNRRIASATVNPWTWRPYTGSNPHDKHVHVSVLPEKTLFDSETAWRIP